MNRNYFTEKPRLIGMVHCLPLPGTAGFKNNLKEVTKQAIEDAEKLQEAGFDAIMVENMGDAPFQTMMEIEQITALTMIATLIKEKINVPLGIDCAFSDYKSSLAIAKSVGADFVRIPVFTDTVIYANGLIYPCARDAILYRKKLHAENVLILADIQVKHTYMLNPNITLEQSAHEAEAAGADVIVVTGASTGQPADATLIARLRAVIKSPLIVGSGVSSKNVKEQLAHADGAVIGSSLKPGGVLSAPVDLALAKSVVHAYKN